MSLVNESVFDVQNLYNDIYLYHDIYIFLIYTHKNEKNIFIGFENLKTIKSIIYQHLPIDTDIKYQFSMCNRHIRLWHIHTGEKMAEIYTKSQVM
jgi:hypothetical protein